MRIFLFAILGVIIFGSIGCSLWLYFYQNVPTNVDLALAHTSYWMLAGAIVGTIAGAYRGMDRDVGG